MMRTYNKLKRSIAYLSAFIVLCIGVPMAFANRQPCLFKLLFSGEQDLFDTWGKLQISVTPTDWISTNAPLSEMNAKNMSPPRWPVACFPLPDGSWEVYSQSFTKLDTTWPSTTRWSLFRGVTTDGVTFSNVETVIANTDGKWTDHLAMAYNPNAGEYLLLKMDVDPRGTPPNDSNGFVYHAWFSADGQQWQKYSGTRPRGGLFYEADAMSLFWSPVSNRFVLVSKSLQPWTKHIPDHGGSNRRVLMIRSSPDGRAWTPDGDLKNVFGLNPPSPDDPHPTEWYTAPDAKDPTDLEFYSGTAFWYHDRAYMMVLNYAASPMFPNEHGEELDNEWWTSPDGLNWECPARGVNAHGAFMDGKKRINMPPLIIDGLLQWQFGWNVAGDAVALAGLKEDRISGVSARANGEFSTRLFMMPAGNLRLNAAVPSLDRPWARSTTQPYLMVEALNDQGAVIPGFERSKCVIWDGTSSTTRDVQVDTTDLELSWNGVSARQLAGQSIRLRFYFASSTIYALTSDASAATYTVTYDANEATGGTAPAPQTKVHNVPLTLVSNNVNLVRTGYTFSGWNTTSGGSGTHYPAGAPYTENADATLYAQWTSLPAGTLATGGDYTEDIILDGIKHRVHYFTNTTTHTFEVLAADLKAEYLIVAGGGGGGGLSSSNASGAGGAGGYLTNVGGIPLPLTAGAYQITVGGGGAGGTTSGTRGSQGANSSAFAVTAIGGGGGGGNAGLQQTGGTGGSGGGHGANNSGAATAGTAGQGKAGGTGFGGGGGAGSSGQAAGTGDGLQNSITGRAVWYAGGGRGAFKSTTPLGGGGMADTSSGGNQATDGQPNTGGGGGARWSSSAAGKSGGSGIVIVRYKMPPLGTLLLIQ